MGKAGGSATSRAKIDAVRANGKLGGRPKKFTLARLAKAVLDKV